MTEVYKNTSQVVHLDITGAQADTTPEATAYRGETSWPLTVTGPETNDDDATIPEGVEQWSTIVGFAQTQKDAEVRVVWDFAIDGEDVTKTDHIDVVTPYVALNDIRDELEVPDDISDEQLIRAERKARRIIDRYTGQNFGLRTETKYMRGNGTALVRLPGRLVTVTSATDSTYTDIVLNGYEIRNDGWYMKRVYPYEDGSFYYTNPITVPGTPFHPTFHEYTEYIITGDWGWERVPPSVRDAALLIIEQELCPQAVYRERFVKTMTAADFRFEVDPQSWRGTGNAVADQLLNDYVVDGISIL